MNNLGIKPLQLLLSAALILLMILTRTNYFDWTAILPSASLAIFFLAGFYLRSYLSLMGFAALAYGCDYWVLIVGGEGCFTPAYGYIFVGYMVVWGAAKWVGATQKLHLLTGALKILAAAVLSISSAFLISNGSFYVFSGNFTDLSLVEYAARVAKYFQSYITDPLIYLGIAAVIHFLVKQRQMIKLDSTGEPIQ